MFNLSKIKKILEDNSFEVMIGVFLTFFLISFIYSRITGRRGSWSSSYGSWPYERKNRKISRQKKSLPRDSKGEVECRRVLQKIFNKQFNKARPDFLSNPVTGGYNLELDCYNPELKLAVEYNGIQHYKYSPFFHKNNEAFLNQKYRDHMKREMCHNNDITLIEVPYDVNTERIEDFLISQLKKHKYF